MPCTKAFTLLSSKEKYFIVQVCQGLKLATGFNYSFFFKNIIDWNYTEVGCEPVAGVCCNRRGSLAFPSRRDRVELSNSPYRGRRVRVAFLSLAMPSTVQDRRHVSQEERTSYHTVRGGFAYACFSCR
jgi:hypothetical protein